MGGEKMSYLAEKNVIGSLLMDKDSISQIYGVLEPEMFTSELLGRIYNEFLKGFERGKEVNLVTLEQSLRCEHYPQRVILEETNSCIRDTLTSANIKAYANAILNDYKAYRLDKMLSAIKVTPNNLKTQIRAIYEELEALEDDRDIESKTLSDITKENKDKYFKEREIKPLMLGFPALDDLLGGLEGGDMIVVGARPGVGKSAFVTQITSNLAKQGKRIGFYNLEMQSKQIYERFVVSESGIGLTRLRRAIRFLGDEKERFDKANETLEKSENIVITSSGGKTVGQIKAESKHMDYDIIIIDYLQLLTPDTTYRGNRTAEVGEISKAIKNLAMEFNIPIIALSQLNRVSEAKETKEPTMAELREAGNIEQDASIIILMWNLDEERIKKGCKVEKSRQGELGKVVMRFNGDVMRFEETSEEVKSNTGWKQTTETPFN